MLDHIGARVGTRNRAEIAFRHVELPSSTVIGLGASRSAWRRRRFHSGNDTDGAFLLFKDQLLVGFAHLTLQVRVLGQRLAIVGKGPDSLDCYVAALELQLGIDYETAGGPGRNVLHLQPARLVDRFFSVGSDRE